MVQSSQSDLKVLLIGNYRNDGQESMRRFADVLARELSERGIEVSTLCPSPVFGRLHCGSSGASKWLGYLDKLCVFPRKLRRLVQPAGVELIVHICDHSNSVYTQALGRVPHLITCHDLLAVRSALGEFSGRRTRSTGRIYQRWILQGLNAANRVACVSKATQRDLLRLTRLQPTSTTMVHNGLNFPFQPLSQPAIPQSLRDAVGPIGDDSAARKVKEDFILHVGGNQWYKNRPGVLEIYAQLCKRMLRPPNLVMVGRPLTAPMRQRIAAKPLVGRVFELTSVSNEDLRTLYGAAKLLLFPSFEEGFGWPIIEAQACGCPVVTTDREPMTEVGGEAAVYVRLNHSTDPKLPSLQADSAEKAADAVLRTLLEPQPERVKRAQCGLRNAGRFSTAQMVESYIALYRQILGQSSFARR